ncbi:MAG TPA: glycosyltransferase family 4 protein [Dehalococcoidia bacterium]|nr:glycosyltransferase family 4 protein [Dehalococcoidia bacterium]
MKLLFFLHQGNMYSGGQGVYTAQLTRELAALGHEVHLVVGPPWPDTDPAVTVHRVPSYSVYRLLELQRMWFYGRHVRSFFHPLNFYELASSRAGQFSVMSAFSWRAFMKWRELQPRIGFELVHDVQVLGYGTLMVHASGMPVVANIHHPLSIDRMNQIRQARGTRQKIRRAMFYPFFMQEVVARRMDRIITGSANSRASVARAFALPPGRIAAIPDGVDTRVFRPLEVARRPDEVLFVGNSDDQNKGARYLLEAAAILRDRGVGFHLTFKDRLDAVMAPRMIEDLGLRDRVTFLGRLPVEELARLYNEAQVLVSPSLYEGFGLPAAEAMACGTPVVATTAGAFPEVIADGETGLLVRPADAPALADAIEALLRDPERRAAMGAAGVRRIQEQFSWRATAVRTAALYEEVLEQRRSRAGR